MPPRDALVTLRPGDGVEIVAPASACSLERLERGLDALRAWGLEPRVPDGLFGRPYIYANDDRARYRQLTAALRRKGTRAVWCVRGGYGSARLLPGLARLRPIAPAKLVVGFSDITALHTFFAQAWGWTTLHGPVVAQLGAGSPRRHAELRRVLFAEQTEIALADLQPLNAPARRRARVRGRLLGGNLRTLQSLLGTPWAPRAAGRILVLEDVNERAYAVDRMLVQLLHSGALARVRAVVLGAFTGGSEADGRTLVPEVLQAFAAGVRCPVVAGLPFGHVASARPLPLGARAELTLGPDPALRVAWRPER